MVEVLERGVSDHNPLMIDFQLQTVKRNTPFRFLNVIADHPDFLEKVQKVWDQDFRRNPLHDIWYKKDLKKPLKGIDTSHFQNTSSNS